MKTYLRSSLQEYYGKKLSDIGVGNKNNQDPLDVDVSLLNSFFTSHFSTNVFSADIITLLII